MADVDYRFALIASDGAIYYPYQKNQKATGRFGFALTRPGEGDRFGKGTYTTDIEDVIRKVVLEGWNVRAKTVSSDGRQREGSLGLGKRTITEYSVSEEYMPLVSGASKKPHYQLASTRRADPLTEALERAGLSEDKEEERVLRAILTRRGQPEFRAALMRSYKGRCCVTGCNVEAVLEAAHIVGHAKGVNYNVTNGMLLRADIHTLFDLGLMTIDREYRIRISGTLAGHDYTSLEGQLMTLPDNRDEWPDARGLVSRQ